MSEGDAKFSAAILSRLSKQQESMERLFSAVEAGIADLADPARMAGIERMLSAQETALAEMIEAVGANATAAAVDRLAAAIREAAPVVNVASPQVSVAAPNVTVKVEPTPITVEAVMPTPPEIPAPVVQVMPAQSQKGAKWEVRVPNTYGGPDRVMTIERVA
jgi:hypothetical protein